MNEELCDVFCFKCGSRMIMEKCNGDYGFDSKTGKKIDLNICIFSCPNYKVSFFSNNGHEKFKCEYRFRHASNELHL